MKRATVVVAAVAALLLMALPVGAIVKGEADGEGHPNVGLVYVYKEGIRQWRCTGTLVAPRVFLTAGHCVEDGVDEARVWFDSDMTDNPNYEGGLVGTPILHPDYFWGGSNPHDVGVVILDEPVEGIEPAPLPEENLLGQLKKDRILREGGPDGAYFTLVGYGRILESWPPPETLSSPIRRVAEGQYVALTKPWLHLAQRAVFDESGTCSGDSGGPTFWVDPEGNEIVVAVTSWGDPDCIATGFNYRVDTPETLKWIEYQIQESEAE